MYARAPPAPVISARDAVTNAAASQVTHSLSVTGLNFGVSDWTMSSRLGNGDCATTSWASTTSAVCLGSLADPLVVTIGSVDGTMTLAFTYDGAVPCRTQIWGRPSFCVYQGIVV